MNKREEGIKRELSAKQMAMVAVGGSSGTGLLLGSGFAIQVAGPAVIVSYIITALMCWTVALAMGEMSSMHPAPGSFGVYPELYLNRWAGLVPCPAYWFSWVIAFASAWVSSGPYIPPRLLPVP